MACSDRQREPETVAGLRSALNKRAYLPARLRRGLAYADARLKSLATKEKHEPKEDPPG